MHDLDETIHNDMKVMQDEHRERMKEARLHSTAAESSAELAQYIAAAKEDLDSKGDNLKQLMSAADSKFEECAGSLDAKLEQRVESLNKQLRQEVNSEGWKSAYADIVVHYEQQQCLLQRIQEQLLELRQTLTSSIKESTVQDPQPFQKESGDDTAEMKSMHHDGVNVPELLKLQKQLESLHMRLDAVLSPKLEHSVTDSGLAQDVQAVQEEVKMCTLEISKLYHYMDYLKQLVDPMPVAPSVRPGRSRERVRLGS